MKLLKRNLRKMEYLPYTGQQTDLNENGEHTGEFYPEYGDPVEFRGNIGVAAGYARQEFYGLDIRYSHFLLPEDPNMDIRETGLVRWNGELYDIVNVHPSLNVLSVALQKQTANHAVGDGT